MKIPDYSTTQEYWKAVPATVDGMLGGFEALTEPDSRESIKFVQEFMLGDNPVIANDLACDCGAGIGRVSKEFLLQVFDKVDLVEQNPEFLQEAQNSYLKDYADRIDRYIPVGLQDFAPETNRYDLIWCQWVLCYLSNDHLVEFLKRCKNAIKVQGLIGIKENITRDESVDFDEADSGYTRSDTLMKQLIKKANLEIVKESIQTDFPSSLYPVKMYMLKPSKELDAEISRRLSR